MALYGSLSTLRAQVAPREAFEIAFAYLEEALRPGSAANARLHGVPSGETKRIELAGGCFALEQSYFTKARPEGFFESHRKYIDVQVVVAGEERMELADVARLIVRQDYQADRDLIIYADCPDASLLRLQAGEAAIFFPVDGHMPGLQAGAVATPVRKTVVKVPCSSVVGAGSQPR